MAQVIIIEPKELQDLIAETVKNAFSEIVDNHQQQKESETFLTREETSKMLHISLSTLDTYTKEGLINAKRVGKRILYSSKDINDAMVEKIGKIKHKMR